ncbi:MAG: HAD family hydrolase [Candidatus Electrothrix sp. AW2]|nr:HAD family hydrolase [Candidatus Electrothrix gigas]
MGIQLLFFDMEGTIFTKQQVKLRPDELHHDHHSLWSRLMYELGPSALADNEKTVLKWEAGGYRSYLDWIDECLDIFKKHGLTKHIFDKALDSIPYNPGVSETFQSLHQQGIKTAIVSGGFIEQARRAQQDLKITHAYAAADLFWDQDKILKHWNIFPSDFEGKVEFMRLLMKEYQLSRQDCAFIGDGKNDVFIAQEVGKSFAYQAHPDLRAVATYPIEEFSKILQWTP